jgi:hypothetical protein
MARMLSVVHAIQPHPGSSLISGASGFGVVTAAFEIRKSSSRRGISCTPIENKGRSLCGGAVDANRSLTARGTLESTDISYTSRIILVLEQGEIANNLPKLQVSSTGACAVISILFRSSAARYIGKINGPNVSRRRRRLHAG